MFDENNNPIIDIHQKCFFFLLEYRKSHPNFFFVPRKNNNKNRLSKGMYFRGNDDYLVLSFWDSSDSKEQIYNISFCVKADGQASIELTCRDDDTKLSHIKAIKNLIENNKIWDDFKKANRWSSRYPKDMDYLSALQDFILNDKPKIDKYIIAHPDCNIPMADIQIHNKYVKALPFYQNAKDVISNKKTGSTVVKASEYFMSFRHNELSNELFKYLEKNNYSSVLREEDCVDIKAIDSKGNQLYFELKTATSVKYAIRYALGQLLEYNHYPNHNKADKLIVVTSSDLEPNTNDIQYLNTIRETYKIPIYYQQFDINNKVLSKEY